MPTLILFERGFVLDPNTETNRVISFVLQFIEKLHAKYYNEPVSVYCLSVENKSQSIPTFTTHTPSLISSVLATFNTPPNTKSYNLKTSLEYAKKIIVDSFGAGGCPVQAIVVTDGLNSKLWELNSERDEKRERSFESFDNLDNLLPLPSFPIRLHVIICGSQSTRANIPTSIPIVVRRTSGSFSYIPYNDSTPLSTTLVKFIDAHYPPYEGGVLACGHLQCEITLYPNPNLILWEKRLPSVLPVVGFLPNKKIMSTPILSRHAVLPLKNPSEFSLSLLLNEVLKNERSTAVIKLADEWYALLNHITFVTAEKEKNSLTLSILPLHLTHIVSYDLSTLAPLPPHPFSSPSKETIKFTSHPSYNPTKDHPPPSTLKPDTLSNDLGKIIRYARALPEKIDILTSECERIRIMSKMFAMPDLVMCAAKALRDVMLSLEHDNGEKANLLADLIESLVPMVAEQPPPVYRPTAPTQIPIVVTAPTIVIPAHTPTPRTSVMSLNNILNQ